MKRARIKSTLIVSTANYKDSHLAHINMLKRTHESFNIHVSCLETIHIKEEDLTIDMIEALLTIDFIKF